MASGNFNTTEKNKSLDKAGGIMGVRRLPKFMRRKTKGEIIFDICNVTFLLVFCLTILYPFWNTFILSFSSIQDSGTVGLRVWNKEWQVESYKFAFSAYGNVLIAYGNSIFRTVVGTFLTLIFTLLAAYPLSKKNIPGRNVMTIIVLITMFFQGGMIPEYLLHRSLGLIDNRWALILKWMTQGYFIIIMRNFLMTIDSAYEESAFMDGANYLQILIKIIIPLSKPVIATIALWSAVNHWNRWFDALLYIRSDSKIVLQLLLRRLIQEMMTVSDALENFQKIDKVSVPIPSVRAAITILTIGPIILVYPFIQKYFVKGVFIGSLKG
jgi:putative aldouronate transport system permease protein